VGGKGCTSRVCIIGVKVSVFPPIILAMDTNIYAAAAVFLMGTIFSLYLMRRRSRLGKRTPKF
jgi:hypothetical protein